MSENAKTSKESRAMKLLAASQNMSEWKFRMLTELELAYEWGQGLPRQSRRAHLETAVYHSGEFGRMLAEQIASGNGNEAMKAAAEGWDNLRNGKPVGQSKRNRELPSPVPVRILSVLMQMMSQRKGQPLKMSTPEFVKRANELIKEAPERFRERAKGSRLSEEEIENGVRILSEITPLEAKAMSKHLDKLGIKNYRDSKGNHLFFDGRANSGRRKKK